MIMMMMISDNIADLSGAGCCMLMFRCTFGFSFTRTADIPSLDKDFGPLPPIVCLFLPSDFLLLDVAPFLSLALVFRMIYLHTLPPHRL